jgi:hypothetical protein
VSALGKAVYVLLASFAWWVIALALIFITAFPCGWGPDADCDMGSTSSIWFSAAAAVVGYAGMCALLYRRWRR